MPSSLRQQNLRLSFAHFQRLNSATISNSKRRINEHVEEKNVNKIRKYFEFLQSFINSIKMVNVFVEAKKIPLQKKNYEK